MPSILTEQEETLLVAAAGMHRDMEKQREKTAINLEQSEEIKKQANDILSKYLLEKENLYKQYSEKESSLSIREKNLKVQEESFKKYKEKTAAELKDTKRKLDEDAAYNESLRQQIMSEMEDLSSEQENIAAERKLIASEKSRMNKKMNRINTHMAAAGAAIYARPEYKHLLSNTEECWTETWPTWTDEQKKEKLNSFFEDDVFEMTEDERLVCFDEILEKEEHSPREIEEFTSLFGEIFPE